MSISDNPDSGTIYEVIQKLELDKSRTDSINHPLEYAIILNELGYLQHLYGQTNEGLNNINRAYKIFTKEEDQEGIAVSSNMIGLIYRNFNDMGMSLIKHLDAYEIFNSLNDTLGLILTSHHLGVNYRIINDFPKAKHQLFKGLSLCIGEFYDERITLYNDLGAVYWLDQKLDSSFYCFKQAMKIEPKGFRLENRKGAVLNNIANTFRTNVKYDSAFYYYHRSLKINEENGFINSTSVNNENLGLLHYVVGQLDSSEYYIRRCLKLAETTAYKQVTQDGLLTLAQIYYQRKQYKTAFDYFAKHAAIKDSAYALNDAEKLAKIEMEFTKRQEVEKLADLESELLNNEISNQILLRQKSQFYFIIFILVGLLFFAILIQLSAKRSRKKLKALNEKLEDRVLIRTQNLSNEVEEHKKTAVELNKAKQKAEESDHLKSAFLANMSHEIRTPMNAIIGFSELLDDSDLEKEIQDNYIGLIKQNSDRLLHLIDDIIDIAKIEANQLVIKKKETHLNQLLEEIKTEQDKHANGRISIVLEVPTDVNERIIIIDPYRVKQVLSNLMNNAIKFTDEGSIRFGYKIKEDHQIEFFVADTGIGIPIELQSSVFDRFRTFESNSDKLYGGTGLGLSICKNLIELMEGQIWLESEVKKGSTFYFSLPLESIKESSTIQKTTTSMDFNWSNKNILIVEDERDSYLLLKTILRNTQANIVRAETGQAAIDACKSNGHIDAILMDIQLPGMNGLEATSQIKSFNSDIPIIAQTAFAMQNESEQCFEAGCDNYISKPINRQKLLSILSQYLEN